MPAIVVIGAGVLGASVAYHVARPGVEVTVLEAGRPGSGTSGASFGWVNAQDKSPAAYFELNAAGVAAHPQLAVALGGDWFYPGGDLAIARGPAIARLEERVERHQAIGYPVRTLGREALAELEPRLELGPDEVLAAHWEAEGWVDAPVLVDRLIAAARARGARVLSGSRVTDIDAHNSRVRRVRLESGDSLRPETLVLAAGTASEDLARLAGVGLPMAPSPGLLAVTERIAGGVGRVIHDGEVALRPDGDGRVVVSSRAVDATLDPSVRAMEPDAEPARELHARASRLLPELRSARLESIRVGVRSVTADGMPAIGFAPEIENLYVVVSHSGVTLAPVVGRLAAEELLGGRAAELEPYRPGRFVAAPEPVPAPVRATT